MTNTTNMLSIDQFSAVSEEIARIMRSARTTSTARACLIATRDREHAFDLIEEAAARAEAPLHHVTPALIRRYDAKQLQWVAVRTGDLGPAEMLDEAVSAGRRGLVIFEEFIQQIHGDNGEVKARLQLAELLTRSPMADGLVILFVEAPEAESRLPAMLAAQIVRLTVPYPRAPQLVTLVRSEIARFSHVSRKPMDVDSIRLQSPLLADGLVGLTRKAARDLLDDALAANATDFVGAARHLNEQKRKRLARELAMEVLDTDAAEKPAGLDNLVAHLQIQKPRMRDYGKGRARGVLLVGPPGTGKTMLARAIGHLAELPVVVFRISSLMNSLLGETERLFSQAFATLEAMAPCIVFIDEIEKAFGDSSERDGGTMMRVTGSLLSWLSDNLYPNYIVATCNSLTRMGEIGLTMTRSERFDACFFVDVPVARTRTDILEGALRGKFANPRAIAEKLTAETEKFSGADLCSVVKQAVARAEHQSTPLTYEGLQGEIVRKRPRVEALYAEFDALRRWGAIYCEPAASAN